MNVEITTDGSTPFTVGTSAYDMVIEIVPRGGLGAYAVVMESSTQTGGGGGTGPCVSKSIAAPPEGTWHVHNTATESTVTNHKDRVVASSEAGHAADGANGGAAGSEWEGDSSNAGAMGGAGGVMQAFGGGGASSASSSGAGIQGSNGDASATGGHGGAAVGNGGAGGEGGGFGIPTNGVNPGGGGGGCGNEFESPGLGGHARVRVRWSEPTEGPPSGDGGPG